MKSVFAFCIFIGLAWGPCLDVSHGAGNEGEIFKQVVYSQSSASGALLTPTPFGFRATVRNSVTNQTQSLTLPNTSIWTPLSFPLTTIAGGHFVFDQRFADQQTLSAAFAPGSYRWIWYRPHNTPTTIDQFIDLEPPENYPQAHPSVVGAFWLNGLLRTAPSGFDLSWSQWNNPPSGAEIAFELWTEGGSGGGSVSPTSTGIVWAGSLSANKIYDGWVSFRDVRQSLSVTDANASSNQVLGFKAGYARTLYFQVSTFPITTETLSSPDVSLIDGKPVVMWGSVVGNTYQLQKSIDLAGWQNVGLAANGTGYPMKYKAPTQVPFPLFYRLSITSPPASTLVIVSAIYGANGTFADVKSYVQSKIVNSAVNMMVSNANLGGDPLPGVTKYLTVTYQVGTGNSQQTTVREGLTLTIP